MQNTFNALVAGLRTTKDTFTKGVSDLVHLERFFLRC